MRKVTSSLCMITVPLHDDLLPNDASLSVASENLAWIVLNMVYSSSLTPEHHIMTATGSSPMGTILNLLMTLPRMTLPYEFFKLKGRMLTKNRATMEESKNLAAGKTAKFTQAVLAWVGAILGTTNVIRLREMG
ncbi:hypothetical protein EJ08DRAFT_679563 [Tothia fuscella]|uniref:Uncharacterized protein n=1 Tax=Tothia fuscella TaxID=1048955 RepID=A0A9P4NQI5_9PEZI|nr:hypothetical protein EJ08DRAFT_679563 [Tothia fuscella]